MLEELAALLQVDLLSNHDGCRDSILVSVDKDQFVIEEDLVRGELSDLVRLSDDACLEVAPSFLVYTLQDNDIPLVEQSYIVNWHGSYPYLNSCLFLMY